MEKGFFHFFLGMFVVGEILTWVWSLDGMHDSLWLVYVSTFIKHAEGPNPSEPASGPMVAELTEDMREFKDKPLQISIVDEDGKPILAGDEERRFFEGLWVHKYNGKYYLSYSTGTTHYIVYGISDNPQDPYVFKGKILTPVIGWTTHHSIVQFGDKWYLFYHDCSLSGGVDHKRCVKYTELKYNKDGTIQTIDPYANRA